MPNKRACPLPVMWRCTSCTLTDDDIEGYNAHAYVLPLCVVTPTNKLLSRVSKMVMIDAICSHHEPLSSSAKQAPFAQCQAGIGNFDTFASLG